MYQHVNEIVSIVTNILCWVHSYWFFGKDGKRVFLFFTGAIILGTLSELAAIVITGGYHYEGFWWYIGPVPLFIGIGWGAAFYFPYVFSNFVLKKNDKKGIYLLYYGLLCAVFAVCIDLWYDPVAVTLKWWTWTNPGPYYNVPTSNFVGWFVFAGLFCPAYSWVDSKNWTFRKKIVIFFALLPIVLLITAAVSFPFL